VREPMYILQIYDFPKKIEHKYKPEKHIKGYRKQRQPQQNSCQIKEKNIPPK